MSVAQGEKAQPPLLPVIRLLVLSQTKRAKLHPVPFASAVIDAKRQNPFGVSAWIVMLEENPLIAREHTAGKLIQACASGFCQELQNISVCASVNITIPDLSTRTQCHPTECMGSQSIRLG